jgi:GNAT superfamily N-acetyltransferase
MAAVAVRSFRTTLRDGTRLTLRCIEPDDKQRLRDGLRHYSPATLYRRFFAPVTELSPEQLKFLTEVDQVDHVAWLVLDDDHPELPGIGVTRWVRLQDEPTIAETALIVQDAYQGRGIGTLLFALLNETARAGGVATLRSLVLNENNRFIATLVAYGATLKHENHGLMRVDLPVYSELDATGTQRIPSQVYAAAIAEVRARLAARG